MNTEEVRFFYFDMGNVLLNFDHAIACRRLAAAAGITPESVREAVFESPLQWDYERGDIDTAAFCEKFRESTDSSLADRDIATAASDIFTLNGPIMPVLTQLVLTGHRLGILSNTCAAHWDFIRASQYYAIENYFSVYALSFELRRVKPDLEIYQAAAELAGVEPQQIFFVDDRAENVTAAREAGFIAEQFTTGPALARCLWQHGVGCNL